MRTKYFTGESESESVLKSFRAWRKYTDGQSNPAPHLIVEKPGSW